MLNLKNTIFHVYLLFSAALNINEGVGSDDRRRLCGAAVSDSPFSSSSPHPFWNNRGPQIYKNRKGLPPSGNEWISPSLRDRWVSWLLKKKRVTSTSTDDRFLLFKKKQVSPNGIWYNGNTRRKKCWTLGKVSSTRTTKSYLLVFDEHGIMRSNVTIHRSF